MNRIPWNRSYRLFESICACICTKSKLCLTKSQSFHFTNKDLAVRCWYESLLAQRQRKHPDYLPPPPVSQRAMQTLLRAVSKGPQTKTSSLLYPVSDSTHLPDLLLFLISFLLSLPVNQLPAPPLDLWLTLVLPVYNKWKALWLKVYGSVKPHYN